MALKVDILIPAGTVTYEEGVGNVTKVNVHFYFANVVHICIHFDDGTHENYYQIPCVLYTPAP